MSPELSGMSNPERANPERGAPQPKPLHELVDLSRGALPEVFEKQKHVTPLRLFLTSVIAVGISQFFVCLALRMSDIGHYKSPYAEALLTGISLVVLIIPVLYAGLYRPMIAHRPAIGGSRTPCASWPPWTS